MVGTSAAVEVEFFCKNIFPMAGALLNLSSNTIITINNVVGMSLCDFKSNLVHT